MSPQIDWPLDRNRIRRGLLNHTFGMVRRNADGSSRPHQGWDFEAVPGTPCYAVADGRVALIRTIGDYGNSIVIEFKHDSDGDGIVDRLFACYSHLSEMAVKTGDTVNRGQQIGLTGNSGNAVSMRGLDCHLHFELRTMAAPGRGLVGRLSPMQLFRQCPMDRPVRRVST
jgi:murein DD-endopeptidase MepM/ murein hydrolase activator NlpD